jgi:hypothetical protein
MFASHWRGRRVFTQSAKSSRARPDRATRKGMRSSSRGARWRLSTGRGTTRGRAVTAGARLDERVPFPQERGDVRCRDPQCLCEVDALQAKPESVNHAYTLITQAFQPTRRSKVGNVFREVVVKLHDDWTPLEDLRKDIEVQVAAEQ